MHRVIHGNRAASMHGLIYLLAALAGSAYLFAAYRLYVIDLSSNNNKIDDLPQRERGIPSSNNQGNEESKD